MATLIHMQKQLVTIKQLTEERSWVSERRARRWVAEHRVPFYKVDGRILFDLAEVDARAESGRVEATVEVAHSPPGLEPDAAPRRRSPGSGGGIGVPRDALLQCERCGAKGTGRIRRTTAGVRITFAGVALRRPATHPGCGGQFRVFDLAGADADDPPERRTRAVLDLPPLRSAGQGWHLPQVFRPALCVRAGAA